MKKAFLNHNKLSGCHYQCSPSKVSSKNSRVVRAGKKSLGIFLLLGCLVTTGVTAQILKPAANRQHNVGLSSGFDNNLFGLTLGYAYYQKKYISAAFIDFTQGTSLIGSGNFRTQIGLQSWVGSFKKFTFKNSIGLVYARSVNKAGNYTGLGLNLVSNPGFRFKRFGLGADVQYNPFLATHINHSEFYQENYYEDVKDGWYGYTAHNVRLGLYLGHQFGKKNALEINLKGGYQNNGQYDQLVPNAYAIISLNQSF